MKNTRSHSLLETGRESRQGKNFAFGARATRMTASSSGTTGTSKVVWKETLSLTTGIMAITPQRALMANSVKSISRKRTGMVERHRQEITICHQRQERLIVSQSCL